MTERLTLEVILDVFSRMMAGRSMGERKAVDLVISALNMAIRNRWPVNGVTHHSDHGSQYTSLLYGKSLREAGILGSMGSVGDAYDNAVAESFFSTLQTELLDRKTWQPRAELRMAVFEYIEAFYNRQRRHPSLDCMTPAEFERQWERQRLAVGD